jgi:hypothetical protein
MSRAGKKSRTQVFEISRADGSLRRLHLEAIAPQLMVRRTARDACRAPRKLGKMPLDILKSDA